MNIKYLLGAMISIPLLPLMYLQGKRIRSSVPSLPEAKGTEGTSGNSSTRKLRLLSIGESTIAGVGVATHEEGFTGTLAKSLASALSLDVDWNVYARSGYTTKRVKEKILPKIKEQAVDLIVIGLGGNDAFTLNSPATWRQHIQELIDETKKRFPATPIVFANMPPIKEFPAFTRLIKFTIGNLVEIFGEELEDLIQNQEKVYYYARKITIDGWTKRLNIQANAGDFFSDGIHPSKLTYQVWARDFCNFMLEEERMKEYFERFRV